MAKTRFLAYTAANRYEKCGKLQWAYDQKQVSQPTNIRDYFTGRVVHEAFEVWIAMRGTQPLLVLYAQLWVQNEAAAVQMNQLAWGCTDMPDASVDRQQQYTKGVTACQALEEDARTAGLLQFSTLLVEPKFRAEISPGVGMFAKPDFVVVHPTEPVIYIGEMKSGSTYDAKQPDWYGAVLIRQPEFAGFRQFAFPMRPNAEPRTSLREITANKRFAQEQRASDIVYAMADDMWPAKQGSYCARCEARNACPAYQATVTGVGQVGLGPR